MTLKERLQAGIQTEQEKIAAAEQLADFQVRCLVKTAQADGSIDELAQLDDESILKLAYDLDVEGHFAEFRENPILVLTEEEIKLAHDTEHADAMGRQMARSFADETRKIAMQQELEADEDVKLAYQHVFGKYASEESKATEAGKKVVEEGTEKAKTISERIKGLGNKVKNMGTAGKAGIAAAGTLGLGGLGYAAYRAGKRSGRNEKRAAAEFEIAAVDVAGQLRDYAANDLPRGEHLTLEKAAALVTQDEYPILERAWEILGEQNILK